MRKIYEIKIYIFLSAVSSAFLADELGLINLSVVTGTAKPHLLK